MIPTFYKDRSTHIYHDNQYDTRIDVDFRLIFTLCKPKKVLNIAQPAATVVIMRINEKGCRKKETSTRVYLLLSVSVT